MINKRDIDVYSVLSGMILTTIIWAPHDLWSLRQRKKKAARNLELYKEMYRGKYGF